MLNIRTYCQLANTIKHHPTLSHNIIKTFFNEKIIENKVVLIKVSELININ